MLLIVHTYIGDSKYIFLYFYNFCNSSLSSVQYSEIETSAKCVENVKNVILCVGFLPTYMILYPLLESKKKFRF